MNVNDQWMLERMQQMAASLAASLPQAGQSAQTEKGETFQDLMNKAKDQRVEAPKKDSAPEKKEPVQKGEQPRKVTETKNPDGTTTKTVNLTPQEAAMVAAGYAKLSPPMEDGTVWMVTVTDENGKLVLPLAELEGGGEFSGSFVDEWTIEATPELTDALEQLLQENSDPRTAGDILSKLEQELDSAPEQNRMEVVVSVPETEQTEDEEMADLTGAMTAGKPLFKDVEAAPVKVGENFQLDTQEPDMDDRLADAIRFAAQQGLKQIEIKLSPENLGSLTVKLTQSADGALQVVLHAANSKAANLLSQHLDGLNAALQGFSQNSEVRVEVQRGEDSQQAQQQQQQQADPDGHNRQRQEQQRQERQEHSEDFVQRLRLGLFSLEDII